MLDREFEEILEKIDLSNEAPAKEPERQYYFIKKMRQIVADLSQKMGRKLTANSTTFGCQMNAETRKTFVA